MPPSASVRQSDGLGIGPELAQSARPAPDRRNAPRHRMHVLVQQCLHRRHANASHCTPETCSAPRILRANRDVYRTAIRAAKISCLISGRSARHCGISSACELCMAVGSASLYCTISMRGYRRLAHRRDVADRTQAAKVDRRRRQPTTMPVTENTSPSPQSPTIRTSRSRGCAMRAGKSSVCSAP